MIEEGQLSAADRENIEKLIIFFSQQAKRLTFPSAGKMDAKIEALELEVAATEMTSLFLNNAILKHEVQSQVKILVNQYMSHHIVNSMSEAFEEIENFLEAARLLAAQTNPIAKKNYEAAAAKKT